MVGGLFSLLWCLIVLALSLVRRTPGSSLFPEIDFASKVSSSREPKPASNSVRDILSTLSTANTFQINRELARSKFYVQMAPANPEYGQDKPIAAIECEIVDDVRISQRMTDVDSYETAGQDLVAIKQ